MSMLVQRDQMGLYQCSQFYPTCKEVISNMPNYVVLPVQALMH